MLENRRIRDENALDIQKRDEIHREIAQWQPVLEAIRAEVAAHAGLPNLTQEIHGMLSMKLGEQHDELVGKISDKEAHLKKTTHSADTEEKRAQKAKKAADAEEKRLAVLKEATEKAEKAAKEAKEKHGDLLNGQQTELTKAELKIQEANKSLEKTKEEEKALLEHRQAEEIRLANKSRDIAIWIERLTKFANEHGLKLTL